MTYRPLASPPINATPFHHNGGVGLGPTPRAAAPSPVAARRAEALARLAARRMQLPPRDPADQVRRPGMNGSPLRLVPGADGSIPPQPAPHQPARAGYDHTPPSTAPTGTPVGIDAHHPTPHASFATTDAEDADHPVDGPATATLPRPGLSHREQQVLRTWLLTDSKAEVAETLSISMGTVNTHLARIRTKYSAVGRRAGTKAALAARAIQDGLISLDEL